MVAMNLCDSIVTETEGVCVCVDENISSTVFCFRWDRGGSLYCSPLSYLAAIFSLPGSVGLDFKAFHWGD